MNKDNSFVWVKAGFSASLLQTSMPRDPSENNSKMINVQETFTVVTNVKKNVSVIFCCLDSLINWKQAELWKPVFTTSYKKLCIHLLLTFISQFWLVWLLFAILNLYFAFHCSEKFLTIQNPQNLATLSEDTSYLSSQRYI